MSTSPPQRGRFSQADIVYDPLGDDPIGTVDKVASEFGLTRTSGTRTPQQNKAAGGSPTSYHLQPGGAGDYDGPPEKRAAFYRKLRTTYGDSLNELFYDPEGGYKKGKGDIGPIGGHGDHVHVAVGGGQKSAAGRYTWADIVDDDTPAEPQAAPVAGQETAPATPPALDWSASFKVPDLPAPKVTPAAPPSRQGRGYNLAQDDENVAPDARIPGKAPTFTPSEPAGRYRADDVMTPPRGVKETMEVSAGEPDTEDDLYRAWYQARQQGDIPTVRAIGSNYLKQFPTGKYARHVVAAQGQFQGESPEAGMQKGAGAYFPVARIEEMRKSGLSDDEIINEVQDAAARQLLGADANIAVLKDKLGAHPMSGLLAGGKGAATVDDMLKRGRWNAGLVDITIDPARVAQLNKLAQELNPSDRQLEKMESPHLYEGFIPGLEFARGAASSPPAQNTREFIAGPLGEAIQRIAHNVEKSGGGGLLPMESMVRSARDVAGNANPVDEAIRQSEAFSTNAEQAMLQGVTAPFKGLAALRGILGSRGGKGTATGDLRDLGAIGENLDISTTGIRLNNPEDPSYRKAYALSTQESLAGQFGQAFGSSSTMMLQGQVLGVVMGMSGSMGAAATGALQQAGQTYDEAVKLGATPEQAAGASLFGAMIGLSEGWGLGGSIDRIALKQVANHLAKEFWKEGLEEGTQETFQNYAQDILAHFSYDPKRKVFSKEALEKNLRAGMIGFVTGGVMGGGGQASSDIYQRLADSRTVRSIDAKLAKGQTVSWEQGEIYQQALERQIAREQGIPLEGLHGAPEEEEPVGTLRERAGAQAATTLGRPMPSVVPATVHTPLGQPTDPSTVQAEAEAHLDATAATRSFPNQLAAFTEGKQQAILIPRVEDVPKGRSEFDAAAAAIGAQVTKGELEAHGYGVTKTDQGFFIHRTNPSQGGVSRPDVKRMASEGTFGELLGQTPQQQASQPSRPAEPTTGAMTQDDIVATPATTGTLTQEDVIPSDVIPSVDSAAHDAATSPRNDLAEPTEGQKGAGNYQKGHPPRIAGLDISIENPEGSRRKPEWPVLKSHYGYIKGTEGADKEHIDAFIKPEKDSTPTNYDGPVYVVDQVKKDGSFDEHKVMLGWGSRKAARAAYAENFSKDFKVGEIREFASPEEFKEWLKTADTTKPAVAPTKYVLPSFVTAQYKKPKATAAAAAPAQSDRDVERSLVRGLLDHPNTDDGIAAAHQAAGYKSQHGFMVHPNVDAHWIDGLSEATRGVMRENGIYFVDPESEKGVGGRVATRQTRGRTLRGIHVRSVDSNVRDLYDTNHVILHEVGHHVWQNVLTPEQRAEFSKRDLSSDYAKRVKAGQVAAHPVGPEGASEEEFAEQFAAEGGNVSRIFEGKEEPKKPNWRDTPAGKGIVESAKKTTKPTPAAPATSLKRGDIVRTDKFAKGDRLEVESIDGNTITLVRPDKKGPDDKRFQVQAGSKVGLALAQSVKPKASISEEGITGESSTSPKSTPPRTQALPSQRSGTRIPPSVTARTGDLIEAEKQGPTLLNRVGDFDSIANKIIAQPFTTVKENLEDADRQFNDVESELKAIAEAIPGVDWVGARLKLVPRLEEKLGARQPQHISDYLGARMTIDDLTHPEAIIAAVEQAGYKVLLNDNFIWAPTPLGYRSQHIQIHKGEGVSIELQMVPKEVATFQKGRGVEIYTDLRNNAVTDPAKRATLAAEAHEGYDAAWAKFKHRAKVTPSQMTGEVTVYRGADDDILESMTSRVGKESERATGALVFATVSRESAEAWAKKRNSKRVTETRLNITKPMDEREWPASRILNDIQAAHPDFKKGDQRYDDFADEFFEANTLTKEHEMLARYAWPEYKEWLDAHGFDAIITRGGEDIAVWKPDPVVSGRYVASFPMSQIATDPARFQYKKHDESGASGTFGADAKWDAEKQKSKPFGVWRDPADGQVYVIDGHNRYNLAKREGVKNVAVRFIRADTAQEAKDIGALRNVQKGHGTKEDTAKFLGAPQPVKATETTTPTKAYPKEVTDQATYEARKKELQKKLREIAGQDFGPAINEIRKPTARQLEKLEADRAEYLDQQAAPRQEATALITHIFTAAQNAYDNTEKKWLNADPKKVMEAISTAKRAGIDIQYTPPATRASASQWKITHPTTGKRYILSVDPDGRTTWHDWAPEEKAGTFESKAEAAQTEAERLRAEAQAEIAKKRAARAAKKPVTMAEAVDAHADALDAIPENLSREEHRAEVERIEGEFNEATKNLPEEPAGKFISEMEVYGEEGKWHSNSKTYATAKEAERAGWELAMKWMQVKDWRVKHTDTDKVVSKEEIAAESAPPAVPALPPEVEKKVAKVGKKRAAAKKPRKKSSLSSLLTSGPPPGGWTDADKVPDKYRKPKPTTIGGIPISGVGKPAQAETPAQARERMKAELAAAMGISEPGAPYGKRAAENRAVLKRTGKLFWSGVVDLRDGNIEQVASWEEAHAADFNHSFYVADYLQAGMKEGDYQFFWIDNYGEIQSEWGNSERVSPEIEKRIAEQIKPREAGGIREPEAAYGRSETDEAYRAENLAVRARAGLANAVSAGESLRESGERASGKKPEQGIIGLGITPKVPRHGRIDFTGAPARTARQVAVMLQAERDPSVETFRIIATKGGKVVGHSAVSSRLPGSTAHFVTTDTGDVDGVRKMHEIQRWLDRVGADAYYLSHNHPSGRPVPSMGDFYVTALFEAKLTQAFKGQVIIDSGEYGVIAPDFAKKVFVSKVETRREPTFQQRKEFRKALADKAPKWTAETIRRRAREQRAIVFTQDVRLPAVGNRWDPQAQAVVPNMPFTINPLKMPKRGDPLHVASIPHELIGATLQSGEDTAKLGKQLYAPGYVSILYRSGKGTVRAIEPVTEKAFLGSGFADFVRGRRRKVGGYHALIYTQNPALRDRARELMRSEAIFDAVFAEPPGEPTTEYKVEYPAGSRTTPEGTHAWGPGTQVFANIGAAKTAAEIWKGTVTEVKRSAPGSYVSLQEEPGKDELAEMWGKRGAYSQRPGGMKVAEAGAPYGGLPPAAVSALEGIAKTFLDEGKSVADLITEFEDFLGEELFDKVADFLPDIVASQAGSATIPTNADAGSKGTTPAVEGERPHELSGDETGQEPVSVPGGREEGGGGDILPADTGRGEPDAGKGAGDTGTHEVASPGGLSPRATAVTPNYVIADPDQLGLGGIKSKFRNNIDAIKTVRKIEAEGRLTNKQVTLEEQNILAKYIGWGGMSGAFNTYSEDAGQWTKERDELQKLKAEGIITDAEYLTAEQSTQYAHYTSGPIVTAMWQMVERMGFTGGRMAEPAVGIGNFFGLIPPGLRGRTKLNGVEMDGLSGTIASLLYPAADIQIKPFQEVAYPDNFFALVMSNFPFSATIIKSDARYKGDSPTLHDYFFLKSLDKVQPGGLLVSITSMGTMDKPENNIRAKLARDADLIAAMRLPGKTFAKTAATDVTTDILIFRKRKPGEKSNGVQWLNLQAVKDKDTGKDIFVNEYFARNPDQILGRLDLKGSMYGGEEKHVTRTDDFEKRFAQAIQRLPEGIFDADKKGTGTPEPERLAAPGDVKPMGYKVQDGKLYQRIDNELMQIQPSSAKALTRIKGMLEVRDKMRELLAAEEDGSTAPRERKELNTLYDAFVKNNGRLHDNVNTQLFWEDPDAPVLLALERVDEDTRKITKSDIFKQPTSSRLVKPTKASDPSSALAITLNEVGYLDMKRMAALLGKSEEDVGAALLKAGVAFNDPIDGWTPADSYLSGNVKKKLATAIAAAATDEQYKGNVEALQKVQPPDVPYHKIVARLGAPWVATGDIADFAAELLSGEPGDFHISYTAVSGAWKALYTTKGEAKHANKAQATKLYGISTPDHSVNFIQILDAALNGRTIILKDKVQSNPDVFELNEEDSAAAMEKRNVLREKFKEWVWRDDDRRQRLHRLYNDQFNNIRAMKWNGQHLTLPGINTSITLSPHHKDAAWQFLTTGRILLAHEVGVGKSFTQTIALMEAKRLGIANKPMLVVPKANIHQMTETAKRLYPGKRILSTARNFDGDRRKRMIAQIATNEWDLVIVTHDHMGMIPVSTATIQTYIGEQIQELEDAIRASQADDPTKGNRVVKDLAKRKEKLQEKLAEILNDKKRDENITWEQLGVDHLWVDEAHEFKSLPVYTSMNRVKGIPTGDSDMATDLQMRMRWLQRRNGGKGIGFSTGTPVNNTLVELYNMQKFMQLDDLQERGIAAFDAWANTFGDTESKFEYKPTGDYEPVTRFSKYSNVPELLTLAHDMMDVRFAADMPWIKRPKRVDSVVEVPMSKGQRRYLRILGYRSDLLKAQRGPSQKGADNHLVIGGDAAKMALDLRLVDPRAKDDPGSKLNVSVQGVLEKYKANPNLTQLVFTDLGLSPTAWGFDMVGEYIDKLVEGGIPRDQIINFSAISDAQKRTAADRIFYGKAKIGIGSGAAMGQGLNLQRYLKTSHNLDVPWNPGRLEQRDGRIHRQGNDNEEINVLRYVTTGSFDALRWQTVDRKAGFIHDAMKGGLEQRDFQEEDTEELTPAQIFAVTSGNPWLVRKIELDHSIEQLESSRNRFNSEQISLKDSIADANRAIARSQTQIERMESDFAQVTATAKQDFSIVFDGKTFTEKKLFNAAIGKFLGKIEAERKTQSDSFNKKGVAYISDGDLPTVARQSFDPTIGEYRGFEININKYGVVSLERSQAYGASDSVDSFDGVLRNIPTHIRKEQESIATYEKSVARAKDELGKPFPKEAELAAQRAEYKTVAENVALTAEEQKLTTEVLVKDSVFLIGEPEVSIADYTAEAKKKASEAYDKSDDEGYKTTAMVQPKAKSENEEGRERTKEQYLEKWAKDAEGEIKFQYKYGPGYGNLWQINDYSADGEVRASKALTDKQIQNHERAEVKTWPNIEAFEEETGHILFTKYEGPPKDSKIVDGIVYVPGVRPVEGHKVKDAGLGGPLMHTEIDGKPAYTDGKVMLMGKPTKEEPRGSDLNPLTAQQQWDKGNSINPQATKPIALYKPKKMDQQIWFDAGRGLSTSQYDYVMSRYPKAQWTWHEDDAVFTAAVGDKRVAMVVGMKVVPELVQSVIDQIDAREGPKEGEVGERTTPVPLKEGPLDRMLQLKALHGLSDAEAATLNTALANPQEGFSTEAEDIQKQVLKIWARNDIKITKIGDIRFIKQILEQFPEVQTARDEMRRQLARSQQAERDKTAGVGFGLGAALLNPVTPPASPTGPTAVPPRYQPENPETARRWKEAKGIRPPSMWASIKERAEELKNLATRDLKFLPRTAANAELHFALKRLEQGKGIASDESVRILQGLTASLKKEAYELFTYRVVFDDLLEEVQTQGAAGVETIKLPFELTPESLARESERLNEVLAHYPEVAKAVRQRQRVVREITADYLAAAKAAIGFEPKLNRQAYYRHQVLAYAEASGRVKGTGEKVQAPTGRGFLKHRHGSELDINTDYLQAEHSVLAQMLYDTQAFKLIHLVDQSHNIAEDLRRQAKSDNATALQAIIDAENDAAARAQPAGSAPLKGPQGPVGVQMRQFKIQKGRAFAELSDMSDAGTLWTGDNNEFADAASRLGAHHNVDQDMNETNALFKYLSALAAKTDANGNLQARMILKAVSNQRQFVQEVLGDNFKVWDEIVPEGYKLWQPREGNVFYNQYTLPERLIDQALVDRLAEIGFRADDLRQAMVMGGRRREFAIPNEVADTLDHFMKVNEHNLLDQGVRKIVRGWKAWQLISPHRAFKYNFRNISGDAEAVFVGNPRAFLRVPKATADLYDYLKRQGVPTPELQEWLDRGGLYNLFQVAEDVGKVSGLQLFRDLKMDKNGKLQEIGQNLNLARKYWRAARMATDFREAILRYSAFIEYRAQMTEGGGKPNNYGASIPGEINAMRSIPDKAYKMANDLLGAYDEVTMIGQWLRERALPFWSWQEVNAKRYVRLFRNALNDGETTGEVARSILGTAVRMSPVISYRVGKFALKAAGLWVLLQVFNNLMFPDEEKDLDEKTRARVHIILGRNADGSVRYFDRLGMLGDFLSWFGLDEAPHHVSDFLNNKRTIKEIAYSMAVKAPVNKLWQGTGLPKMIFELVSGRNQYPDAWRSRNIRDRWQFLFNSFALGDEYGRFSGKPARPIAKSIRGFFFYEVQPEEAAYNDILSLRSDFKIKRGDSPDVSSTNDKGNAVYYMKLALKVGDLGAARRYLAEYAMLGGTPASLQESIKTLAPLAGLKERDREEFLKTLTPDETSRLTKAQAFYDAVIDKTGDIGPADLLSRPIPKEVRLPVDRELQRFGINFPYPQNEVTIQGKKQQLAKDRFEDFQQRLAEDAYRELGQLIDTPKYKGLSDARKQDALESFKRSWSDVEHDRLHAEIVGESGAGRRQQYEAGKELRNAEKRTRELQDKDRFMYQRDKRDRQINPPE